MAKVKEFWETDAWRKYLTQPSGGAPTVPGVSTGELQAGAIGPLRAEYKRAIPGIESRISKRMMGRSGAYVAAEQGALRDFLTRAGAISADVTLRGGQLQIEAAKLGLTSEQFQKRLESEERRERERLNWEKKRFERGLTSEERRWMEEHGLREWEVKERWGLEKEQLEWEKEKFGTELSFEERQWLREQGFSEWAITQQLELEADKFNWTVEEFQQRLEWEKDQFKRTLSSEDRRFDMQMELEWERHGLNEQEIENEKQMFYDQLKQYQDQFDRELSFKETQALRDYELALSEQGLTQQQIDNQMSQFNKELEWQQDRFDKTFTFEQTKWMDEFTFTVEQALFQNELSRDQFKETMRQFDMALKQSGDLEKERMVLQEDLAAEQRRLERDFERGRITRANMEDATRNLQIEYDKEIADARLELEQQQIDIMNNEIFGYWDEGYGPGSDNPPPPKYSDPPEYDLNGNPILTQEWELYMDQYYHPGALDLKEWEIRIEYLLGLRGVSNELGFTTGPGPRRD